MKNRIIGLLICFALIVTLSACASKNNVVYRGMLSINKISEEDASREYNDKNEELFTNENDEKIVEGKVVYFDDLVALKLALDNEKIDSARLSKVSIDYLKKIDEKFTEKFIVEEGPKISYSMLLSEENEELANKLSSIIKKFKDNGKLNELVNKNIYEFDEENLIDETALNKNKKDKEIVVAVTGDLPPLDYTRIDGTPCGFNVALLEALEDEIDANIRIIGITSGARATALKTKNADVVFWVGNCELNPNADIPEGTIITEPYFIDTINIVENKNLKDKIKKLLNIED